MLILSPEYLGLQTIKSGGLIAYYREFCCELEVMFSRVSGRCMLHRACLSVTQLLE